MVITERINLYIAEQPEWQRKLLVRLRQLIHSTDAEVEETWKWNSPHFDHQGIMIGLQAFKVALYVIWPFGRTVVHRGDAGVLSVAGNVVWVIFAGWWLALETIVVGLLLCVTVIGIPFGVACFKLLPIVFRPFGREIVPSDALEAGAGVAIGR